VARKIVIRCEGCEMERELNPPPINTEHPMFMHMLLHNPLMFHPERLPLPEGWTTDLTYDRDGDPVKGGDYCSEMCKYTHGLERLRAKITKGK
jgi:hypothetical protein